MEIYDELRIEITAGELLRCLLEYQLLGTPDGEVKPIYMSKRMPENIDEVKTNYKHNNTFIPGFKDIGLNGWITFVLRKQESKDGKIKDESAGSD